MHWKRFVAQLALVACLALALWGCSNPEEKAARAELDRALALEQQHDLPAASQLLGGLLKKYPQAEVSAEALSAQQRVLKQMDNVQRELSKTLESMVLVVAGYQSMTGKPLERLADLDGGDYMFDSAYLAEAVPQGVDAYVLLEGEGRFRLWAYNREYRMGMQRESTRHGSELFDGESVVNALRSDYATETLADNLIALTPRMTAEQQ